MTKEKTGPVEPCLNPENAGWLDAAFYLRHYHHALLRDGYDDPLKHFLEVGVERGYLPSPDFDPVVYRLRRPECGRENPVFHAMRHGPLPRLEGGLLALFPDVEELRSRIKVTSTDPIDLADPEEQSRNMAHVREIAQGRPIPFSVGDKAYELRVPDSEEMLRRMDHGRPFAYVRLPHGFWDSVYQVEMVRGHLGLQPVCDPLSLAEKYALAVRLCGLLMPWNSNFIESFQEEVLLDAAAHVPHPDFMRAVSFKGVPTWREEVFNLAKPTLGHLKRLHLFAAIFTRQEPVYDAMLPKRWMVSGDAGRMAGIAARHGVVLIANDRYEDMDRRWGAAHFRFVSIEPDFSQLMRWDILERTRQAVETLRAEGQERIYVFSQCGASLAYWLFDRLFKIHPDVFYFDLGQAIKAWYLDASEPQGPEAGKPLFNPMTKDNYVDKTLRLFGEQIRAWAGAAGEGPASGSGRMFCSDAVGRALIPMAEQLALLKDAMNLQAKGQTGRSIILLMRLLDGERWVASQAAALLSGMAETKGDRANAIEFAEIAASRDPSPRNRERLAALRAAP